MLSSVESQASPVSSLLADVGTPFKGYICTTGDALLVVEATRQGILPHVNRRLSESERKSCVQSGSVFVFSQRNSDIKRWTDSRFWSPSRILGNFLLYRETTGRQLRGIKEPREQTPDFNKLSESEEAHFKKWLVGSLHRDDRFKPDGLIKKTLSVPIDGIVYHLVSYYAVDDVLNSKLDTPSNHPILSKVVIPREMLKHQFRTPITVIDGPVPAYGGVSREPGYDGLRIENPPLPVPESATFIQDHQLLPASHSTAEPPAGIAWAPQRTTRYESSPSNEAAPLHSRCQLKAGALPLGQLSVLEPVTLSAQLSDWLLSSPLTPQDLSPRGYLTPSLFEARSCAFSGCAQHATSDQLVIPAWTDYHLAMDSR